MARPTKDQQNQKRLAAALEEWRALQAARHTLTPRAQLLAALRHSVEVTAPAPS
jgi:hypothetical protein